MGQRVKYSLQIPGSKFPLPKNKKMAVRIQLQAREYKLQLGPKRLSKSHKHNSGVYKVGQAAIGATNIMKSGGNCYVLIERESGGNI